MDAQVGDVIRTTIHTTLFRPDAPKYEDQSVRVEPGALRQIVSVSRDMFDLVPFPVDSDSRAWSCLAPAAFEPIPAMMVIAMAFNNQDAEQYE